MTFKYVKPNDIHLEIMEKFRDKFEQLDKEINETLEDCRGKTLARTKLEESSFWLNKAIINND